MVFGLQLAVAAQPGQVEKRIGTALALQLNASSIGHLFSDDLCCLATGKRGVQRRGFARDGQVQVDTIKQRPGQLATVTLNLIWRTAAAAARVTQITAWARVHCRNQLKARGEPHLISRTSDNDATGLQRFSKHLQNLAVEFGKLVQKQHALMRESDFPGPWAASAVRSIAKCETLTLYIASCE